VSTTYPRTDTALVHHGLSLHPSILLEERQALVCEMARLIVRVGRCFFDADARLVSRRFIDLTAGVLAQFDATEMARPPEVASARAPTVEVSPRAAVGGFDESRRRPRLSPRVSERQRSDGGSHLASPRLARARGDARDLDIDAPCNTSSKRSNRYWSESPSSSPSTVGCARGRRVE